MGALIALLYICISWGGITIGFIFADLFKNWRLENMGKSNPNASEFFEGYRQAQQEILLEGLNAFEAKYEHEFLHNDTVHFRGMRKAYQNEHKRFVNMAIKQNKGK